ncbi:hypothetical protein FHT43_002860 [Mycolicibacterium sp. BK607]|nr:hypothetical protein [Mycolicibacterium sp. BK607]
MEFVNFTTEFIHRVVISLLLCLLGSITMAASRHATR